MQAGIQVFFSPDATDPPVTSVPLVLPRMLLKPFAAATVNPADLYCQHICEYEPESTSQVYLTIIPQT